MYSIEYTSLLSYLITIECWPLLKTPVLPEQRAREEVAGAWYAEAARRKSEQKRKLEETGVDDIE